MTQLQTPNRTLGQLNEEDRYRAFDDLQLSMGDAWDSIQKNLEDESVVVVPSISIERTTASSGTVMQAMEERALFLLLLLRQPRLRMIYVTSQPISEAIIEYYLGLLPGVIPSHARARLTLVAVGDGSPTSLSSKLLARPRLLREIRSLIPNPDAMPPDSVQHHTARAGCRAVAWHSDVRGGSRASSTWAARPAVAGCSRSAGCSIRSGRRTSTPSTTSWPLCRACVRGARRSAQAIVKINEGVSGSGNASMDLDGLPAPGSPDEAAAIAERLQKIRSGGGEADGRRLSGGVREGRRHRRRADHRRRAGEPERADAGAAGRHRRVAVHARPAPRRCERSEVSGLCVPGGSRLCGEDRRAGDGGRPSSRAARRARPVRSGFRNREGRDRGVDAVCDRAEPSQGRDHSSVPDAAVLVRRQLRRRARRLRDPRRQPASSWSRRTISKTTGSKS